MGKYFEGLGVWKVCGEIVRADWAEFRMIWSQETSGSPPNYLSEFVALPARPRPFFLSPETPAAICGASFFIKTKKNNPTLSPKSRNLSAATSGGLCFQKTTPTTNMFVQKLKS